MQYVSEIEINEKKSRYWWVCILLGIVVAAALIFSAMQEKKWMVASILATIGMFSCFVIQKKLRMFLLFLIVFIIPFRIDFYLLYKPTNFIQTHGLPGLPVTSFDIVLIVLTCYLLFQVLRREYRFYFYPAISIPALVYLVLSGISAFWSDDWSLSFTVFVLMIKSYVAFLFFANRIRTKEDLSVVVLAFAFAVLLQSVAGVLQYATDGSFLQGVFGVPEAAFRTQMQGEFILSRVGGTIGHPNDLAKYLCFCIPVLLAYMVSRFNPSVRILSMIAAMAGGVTLLLTLSRGSWVALGVTFMFLLYEIFRRYFKSRAKSIIMVILCTGFLFGATIALVEDVRIRLFEQDYRAAESRIPMAEVALNIIEVHPIAGVGLNNYANVMHGYDHTREWQTYKFPHPVHNSYLLIAAESGIPTLLAFLWLIGAVVARAWPALGFFSSSLALLQIGCLGGMITWLISGMFDRNFAGTNLMLWLSIALIAASHRILSEENRGELNS